MAKIITFRDTLLQRVPWWLRNGISRAILWAFGILMDLIGDAAVSAVKRGYPGLESPDSLALIGRERRIRRGPTETDASYAARLRRWLDDHRTRGGPYALLAQVGLFWQTLALDLIYRSGVHYARAVDASVVRSTLIAPYDLDAVRWARWWLHMAWPVALPDDGLWSSPGTYDDGGVWDSGLAASDVALVRLVPSEWNNAHCIGQVVLLSPGSGTWDFPIESWASVGLWDDGLGVARVSLPSV